MVHGRSSSVSHGGMPRVYAGALRCQSGELAILSMKRKNERSGHAGHTNLLLEKQLIVTGFEVDGLLRRRHA